MDFANDFRIKQRLAAEGHKRFDAEIHAYLANRLDRDIRVYMLRSEEVFALRTMLASSGACKRYFKLYSFKILQVFVHFLPLLFAAPLLRKNTNRLPTVQFLPRFLGGLVIAALDCAVKPKLGKHAITLNVYSLVIEPSHKLHTLAVFRICGMKIQLKGFFLIDIRAIAVMKAYSKIV
jgi:hypothetical protein